jgi:hypothetical protein
MTIAKVISMIGLVVMTIFIGHAAINGNFSTEGSWIISHPWGQASLADLYTGFILFSMWVVYREKSNLGRVLWIIAIMLLGNWATALYALLALHSSNGDWQKLFHGDRVRTS